ncbi:MAG: NAD(P)H-binding protein [Allobranchiibius sp.]
MSAATDPTAAPNLLSGLPVLGRSPVLVTGGTGTLGRHVVDELLDAQVPVRVLTRRFNAATAAQITIGDLRTGVGLRDAVEGVGGVIHCATSTRGQEVDVDGLERLCNALSAHNPTAHLVHVSIVGCWDSPLPYYRVKAEAETVVGQSGRPFTIVRATQFHEFVERICGAHVGSFGIGIRGLRFAPCDPQWVAQRLVDIVLEEMTLADAAPHPVSAGSPVELAGPEVLSARDVAVLTAHLSGRPTPRQILVPRLGRALTALAAGSNLPGEGAVRGGRTYAQWWTGRAS